MIEIVEYLDASGRSLFAKWFDGLDARAAAVVTMALARLADGNTSNVAPIGEGVAEIKIDRGPAYRVYFGWDGRALIVLLGGGTKRRQQRDIAAAAYGVAQLQGTQIDWQAGPSTAEIAMPLTRSFKTTVQVRIASDPGLGEALLQEAVQALLTGDAAAGRAVLRDYINATMGFDALAEATGRPSKSLMRMFGPRGNPQAKHLLATLNVLQRATGVRLEVRAVREAA